MNFIKFRKLFLILFNNFLNLFCPYLFFFWTFSRTKFLQVCF